MSILLIVMSLLAVFHLFYQSVILKTNNQLFENDLNILKHEMDIFEIKNLNKLNESERSFLEEAKSYVKFCPQISKTVTAIEFISDTADFRSSKEYGNHAKEIRALKVQSEPIWNFMADSSRLLIRNITSNGSLFLFILSPLLFLILLYAIFSGRKLSIEHSVERLSSRHC